MRNKTLIFFIDAVRKDYISKQYTPFLYDFLNNETYLDWISQLWYSSWIHPSIWKWKHQENHWNFLVYYYQNSNWPFKWIKYLKFIPTKIREIFLAILKAPYYMLNFKDYFPMWYKKKILPIPASIDPNIAEYFNNKSSIYDADFFKILEKNNIKYSSQPDFDNKMYWKWVWINWWKITDNDLDYYFSYEIDPIWHYNWPKSQKIKEKMSEIDKKVYKLIQEAKTKYENVEIFIFSDHWMVEVNNNIDIKSILYDSNLKVWKDFKVFFDSTMVRIWSEDKKVKQKIIDIVWNIDHVTYLDEKLKNKYKINFKNNKWWDLIFLVDPWYRVFPDYFAPVRFNTKGMHWYWPENDEWKWIFMTNTFKTDKKEINVVDFMPTMLKAMWKQDLIPNDIDWKSII